MPQLIAQGSKSEYRWRRPLSPERMVSIGRNGADWNVPWDDRISRRHVSVAWRAPRLSVERDDEARNPVFFKGRQNDAFQLDVGEHFVIGSTTFSLVDERVDVTVELPLPRNERTFSRQLLETVIFENTSERIEVLSQVPEMIEDASNDDELFIRLVGLLLRGIPESEVVALVVAADASAEVEVPHWDRRRPADADVTPSARLIRRAIREASSVVHLWQSEASPDARSFTAHEAIDWAFCTPIRGAACRGWGIYVAGGNARSGRTPIQHPEDLRESVKFTELVATTVGSLRELTRLERHKAALSQFISPIVLDAVADQDPDRVLEPREAEVSVLFCDLRGFSQRSERSAHDVMGLLQRVSQALGVMTRHILAQGGVIGDFHGDAAMGFWGWPLPQADAIPRACQAAIDIRNEFAEAAGDHPLADFRVGIGIASGPAIAGKIGTVDQVKVTVFGPVVNLASRLEGLTKVLRTPILVDEATAAHLRELASPPARLRRVARIRPYGLQSPLEVTELVPPRAQFPDLDDEHIAAYESALDALLAGDWERAFSLLHHVPAEDRVKDFLTVFIAQHNRTPPPEWDGVIPIQTK